MPTESTVDIGLLLPEVLGTYGDSGNAQVLARRLAWRGVAVRVIPIAMGQPVPRSLDLYVLGGGEDAAQELAARQLAAPPGLVGAARDGAVIFAVCAGFQVLGEEFVVANGRRSPGLGLLDVRTSAMPRRAVGEIVTRPEVAGLDEPLTGFENHQGRTERGPAARPLGTVRRGIGNGDGSDGAVQGRVMGTYLHGPALARNPQVADLLLRTATGRPLAPLDLPAVAELREERLHQAS